MIPGILVDFLAGASVAIASTRNENLVPHVHWLSGWQVEDDHHTVFCLVASGFNDSLLDSLRAHGHFAMVAERIGPHECYQFKGSYVDSRPATVDDQALVEACRARFAAGVRGLHGDRYSDRLLRDSIPEPLIAIRFRVNEIYLQTPGPGAGLRIVPPEE